MIPRQSLEGSKHLVVAWAVGKSYAARQVKMSKYVADELTSYAYATVDGLVNPVPYAPDAEIEDNSHMEAARDESLDTSLIDKLSEGSSLDLVSDHELRTKNLVCHALIVTSEIGITVFVKKRSPVQLAKKSMLAAIIHGRLDELESPLFAFDNSYDVIVTDSQLFVLHKKSFEGLFKNSPAVLAKTSEWINEVAAAIPFAEGSADELDIILKRNSVLRNKFLAVRSRPYLGIITPTALRDEMEKFGLNPSDLMEGNKLKVTSQNAKDVLRLLNEDFFSGGFSRQQYAAGSKRTI